MPRGWLTDWVVRLILLTRTVDFAFKCFDRLRSKLVLALASDAVLDRFNDVAYGKVQDYRPDSKSFRAYLFPWEEHVIDRFLPPPPARVLVGGAGGGREVFALAKRGYEVVAFEPSQKLAETMAASCTGGMRVAVYRARYEDLPALLPVGRQGTEAYLDCMEKFDAALLGWGSFSHLKTEQRRIEVLQAFARVTGGPVVVGFLFFGTDGQTEPGRLSRIGKRGPGDNFSIDIGFYHEISRSEFVALSNKAGLEIVYLNTDSRDTNWPHAVVQAPR
jgi:hypothetical protein